MHQLSIPDPCHERWENMEPAAKHARFCSACSKNIVDFSKMTDREMAVYLHAHPEQKLCGRFAARQLNRPIRLTVYEERTVKGWKQWGLAVLVALGWKQTGAQVAPPPPPVVAQEDSTSADQQIPVERVQINGRVYDHETGEPVPFARVMVLQTMEGALTDMDGYFVLKIRPETAPAVLNLSIECIGFLTVTREVALRTNGVSIPPPSLTIHLTPKQEQVFMGIVVTDSPEKERRQKRLEKRRAR